MEFGARAESYSRTRRGPNSNNVFFALLVPSAFSSFSPAVFLYRHSSRKRERERKGESSTYPPFTVASNISLRPDSSARIEVVWAAMLNSD